MKIAVSKIVDAPAEVLWPYIGDYPNIYLFHPLVKNSRLVEQQGETGIGAKRECKFTNGHYAKEVVTEWDEGCSYTVDIYETSMPITSGNATLGVLPLENGKSRLFMNFELTPKNKLMGSMMYLMFRFRTAPMILNDLHELYKLESSYLRAG